MRIRYCAGDRPLVLRADLRADLPLVGNYGIPADATCAPGDLSEHFESNRILIKGLVNSSLSGAYSHWSAVDSLNGWMARNGVPGIAGIDTRALTKHLRTKGCMLGKILAGNDEIA